MYQSTELDQQGKLCVEVRIEKRFMLPEILQYYHISDFELWPFHPEKKKERK